MVRFIIGSSILSFLLFFRTQKLGANFITTFSGLFIFSGLLYIVPRLRDEKMAFKRTLKKGPVIKLFNKSKLENELERSILFTIAFFIFIFIVFWIILKINPQYFFIFLFVCVLLASFFENK